MTKAGFAHIATLEFLEAKAIPLHGTVSVELKPGDTSTTLVGSLFRGHCFD